MPTERPRVTITVTEEQLREIEEYRYGNKMKNQTQAILSLVRAGLDESERRENEGVKKASDTAKSETEAVREETVQAFKFALGKAGLLNEDQDLSDVDLEFLKAMFVAIKAHFKQGQESRN